MTDIPANPRRAQATEARKPAQAEKSPEEVINAAPLQTIQVEQTNPVEAVKPWRAGTNMSEDELMLLTEKISINLPIEASLLVNYLVADQRVGGLGRKYTKTNFIVEAIMDKAKRDLKKKKGITY